MAERIAWWMITTCLFGLLPVIARAFVWTLYKSGIDPIAISDLVAFGLVIHSANIAEVSRSKFSGTVSIILVGLAVPFIVLYTLLLYTTIASGGNLNHHALLTSTIWLSIGSFMLGLFVAASGKPKLSGNPAQ